ncbi:hypothetical protein [Pontibacter fetidus]|uniref:Uncharacterized protein n=1 Tax=Pontibacter fetidus TaxID=2700082 RepID=A0A6B2GZL5_9BACT|nr:hypothetical protein [Pontibacter fetidus]NDK56305.1 hypothetical protein [Pontibacter fetidus]
MNTKLLMSASALVLAAIGLLLSFLPDEILQYAGVSSVLLLPVILQLLGAAYLGFALLNWMARANLIGGIYSRPVAIGNLMHFIVSGLALLKAAFAGPGNIALWVTGVVFIGFAILFAKVTFTHPLKEKSSNQMV